MTTHSHLLIKRRSECSLILPSYIMSRFITHNCHLHTPILYSLVGMRKLCSLRFSAYTAVTITNIVDIVTL